MFKLLERLVADFPYGKYDEDQDGYGIEAWRDLGPLWVALYYCQALEADYWEISLRILGHRYGYRRTYGEEADAFHQGFFHYGF